MSEGLPARSFDLACNMVAPPLPATFIAAELKPAEISTAIVHCHRIMFAFTVFLHDVLIFLGSLAGNNKVGTNSLPFFSLHCRLIVRQKNQ